MTTLALHTGHLAW